VGTHDWEAAVAARSNLLVEGDAADTEQFVRELIPRLTGPVVPYPQDRSLPPGDAIVLVANVDALPDGDQRDLMSALDDPTRRLQVVCTSATPLFNRVERGEFLAALYYRLNMIRIALSARGQVPDRQN
jgi:hypothetical protein